jgi:F-type H+-transporting ATPase subunit a
VEFFPKVAYILSIMGISVPITETVAVTWGIMSVLILSAYFAGNSLKKIPRGIQNVVEVMYEGIENLIKVTLGEKRNEFIPYIGTLALYLLVANLVGLIALRPPTADLSTTLALALITFVLTQIEGVKKKRFLGYLKGFFQPLPLMAPLNFIGALANPFSLAFRLFGNIVGGMVIMSLVYTAVPILIPVPLHFYFDMFSGILQTFIFIMLTLTFITMAAD